MNRQLRENLRDKLVRQYVKGVGIRSCRVSADGIPRRWPVS
jgi:hypothetical protein